MTEKEQYNSSFGHGLSLYVGGWSKQVLIYCIAFLVPVLVALAADASGLLSAYTLLFATALTVALLLLLPIALVFREWASNQNLNASKRSDYVKAQDQEAIQEGEPYNLPSIGPHARNRSGLGMFPIGRSPVMLKVFTAAERIAPTDSSVLITGGTGTGKELLARMIHQMSPRASQPFVDINLSAIPSNLIEMELFGHHRETIGSPKTIDSRAGLIEVANGGTLFLDEVDSLPLPAQAHLLRFLQERTIRRIGGRTRVAVNVRIISATNSDLSAAIQEGFFRADLYYRLRVFPLYVPYLFERVGDIELLIEHFQKAHAERHNTPVRRFTEEAMRLLIDYPWPGNVRELESTVEYALAIGRGEELGIEDLPPEFSSDRIQPDPEDLRELQEAYIKDRAPLAEIEKRYILSVLQQFSGNQVRAAAALGIDRTKLYRRLKQYGISALKTFHETTGDASKTFHETTGEPKLERS